MTEMNRRISEIGVGSGASFMAAPVPFPNSASPAVIPDSPIAGVAAPIRRIPANSTLSKRRNNSYTPRVVTSNS